MAQSDDGRDWTDHELRSMDRETARETLPVAQFERWEKLDELYQQAEETKERWEREHETVTELTVHADAEQLGTDIDVYGNDLVVHINSDDRHIRQAVEKLESLFDGVDDEDVDNLDKETAEAISEHATTLLDRVILRWNGTDWNELSDERRDAVLTECREKWGLDGLLLAWADIAAAVRDERQERVDVVESFR